MYMHRFYVVDMVNDLQCCWLGGRKGIQPVKKMFATTIRVMWEPGLTVEK